ncbi:hypothetical protein MYX78_10135 [Acidobacteria bacterium AH-259-G07]|nr:hypothetical protein [Acidobacteria bacterium AH-259-G07]
MTDQTDNTSGSAPSEREKQVHEFYHFYRGAAVFLSATIITISSAIIFALLKKELGVPSKFPFQALFSFCLVAAVSMQYLHFRGYMHLARWASAVLMGDKEDRIKQWESSIKWFDRLDFTTTWLTCLPFIVGLTAFLILLFA